MSAEYGKTADREILDSVAAKAIAEYSITAADLTIDLYGRAVQGEMGWQGKIESIAISVAIHLSAELRGRIIFAAPNAALDRVHGKSVWLNLSDLGPNLFMKLTAMVIACRIRDVLEQDNNYYTAPCVG